jgi:nitrate/TMAO reductase-like tetraheme cytochrome c subunit
MRQLLRDATRNLLGLAGVAVTTISGVLIVTLAIVGFLGIAGGPYLGIITFLVLPFFFVLGLLLIPIGGWAEHRKARRAAAAGEAAPGLPVIDLNRPRTRNRLIGVGVLTVVNVVIVALAAYGGVETMDTPAFCGSCHSVMDPEFTAYRRSPHARVACVDCHIGAGASWFVRSKLSGAWQVVSVAFDLYPRPIPVPVHNLRPARETCEQCHWPTKFVGDRLKVITRHDDDEKSTEKRTALLLKVGGGSSPERSEGIHWHVAPGVKLRYLADAKREKIGVVELTRPDGTVVTFRSEEGPQKPSADASWRVMDCVDCHNRPTHVFRTAEDEIDEALNDGHIDRSLPYARREALKALKAARGSHGEAAASISKELVAFYRQLDPAGFPARQAAVEAAAAEVGKIYAYDVWPSMNIDWGTYPTFLGHDQAPGCWRCHDEAHATRDGKTISQDCTICHTILAQDEANPKILKDLGE